jgi:hypothetical protein
MLHKKQKNDIFIKNQKKKLCKKFHTGAYFFLGSFSKKEAKHKNKVF